MGRGARGIQRVTGRNTAGTPAGEAHDRSIMRFSAEVTVRPQQVAGRVAERGLQEGTWRAAHEQAQVGARRVDGLVHVVLL